MLVCCLLKERERTRIPRFLRTPIPLHLPTKMLSEIRNTDFSLSNKVFLTQNKKY